MTERTNRFAVSYLDSLAEYIREPGEITLQAAYELGRDAVQQELNMLDLAIAHHEALASILRRGRGADDEGLVDAAGHFFLESIAAFEMVQRGLQESHEAAQVEQRHAEMLRQLSHFLADASLALDTSDSLDEMLRLVAEQARELVRADCCLIATKAEDKTRVRASSYPEDDLRWVTFARWVDLSDVDAAMGSTDRAMRIRGDDIATHVRVPGREPSGGDLVLRDWLGTRLTALDGQVMGSLHMVNERHAEFTAVDEAVVVHIAQMSAAAMERAQLYSRPQQPSISDRRPV
jgi:transcriptional regulator with GAF, ATPase, and Fis domain